ncbi:DUF4148 domain-containing protein [Pseudoduganella sp. UC29_106]|uniref:DUF4148 domain-containing protein n=1 Tax=Pseudoduganella sp. UC29_106 TaxID=3374553 RepID=UPI003757EF0F
MNAAHFLIATITLSAASAAFAADNSNATTTTAASAAPAAAAVAATQKAPALTREQVMAEFYEARKNGTLIQTEADLDVAQTRQQTAK